MIGTMEDMIKKPASSAAMTLAQVAALAISAGQSKVEHGGRVYNVRKYTQNEMEAIWKNQRKRKAQHKARMITKHHPNNGHQH